MEENVNTNKQAISPSFLKVRVKPPSKIMVNMIIIFIIYGRKTTS